MRKRRVENRIPGLLCDDVGATLALGLCLIGVVQARCVISKDLQKYCCKRTLDAGGDDTHLPNKRRT
jgi:hypothetical protein